MRGQALIAVSGGETPRLVFEYLSEMPIDWARVTITLTDERWVPASDGDSNEALLRSCLIDTAGKSCTFVPLYGGEMSPKLGHDKCEYRLRSLQLPFDAVYLGMGSDGHIASLFPGAPTSDGSNLCLAVSRSGSRVARMSLSLPTLLNTRHLMLLYSGAEKRETYLQVKNTGNFEKYPLGRILVQPHPRLVVFWAP